MIERLIDYKTTCALIFWRLAFIEETSAWKEKFNREGEIKQQEPQHQMRHFPQEDTTYTT
jgi:hypothetical protein